jgi:uncharacterized protein YndB with AHSA1/START domain
MNFTTEEFRTLICAQPQQVWDELTATGRPLSWFYGMVAESTWQSGADVRAGIEPEWGLVGEILTVDCPHRLSFTLGDTLSDPSVFITWELAHDSGATIVRLIVDEPQPHRDATREMELAWLPSILKLTALFSDGATTARRETEDSGS